MLKREAKEVAKRGEPFDPSNMLEVKFLRNIIEEFLEVVFQLLLITVILFFSAALKDVMTTFLCIYRYLIAGFSPRNSLSMEMMCILAPMDSHRSMMPVSCTVNDLWSF